MRSIETQSEEPDGLQIMIEGDGRNCISVGGGGHGFEASGIDAAVLRGRGQGLAVVQYETERVYGASYTREDSYRSYLE